MQKVLDLHQSVYTLCTAYPELVAVMEELGFRDIAKPGMLQTAGRFMTLKKGAAMKGIELTCIIEKLKEHGFTVEE